MQRRTRQSLALALGLALTQSADANDNAEVLRFAEVNVRHHLIPGVKLNAKSPKTTSNQDKSAQTAAGKLEPQGQRPVVPPVPKSSASFQRATLPSTAGSGPTKVAPTAPTAPAAPATTATTATTAKITWESECSNPVKVGFFGDFWVSPQSPAAKLKHTLLDPLRPLLSWADFNVVNYEGVITNSTKRAFQKFPFALKQAPESLKWLSGAGVKYLTRANNHSMDFGWDAAQSTSAAMQSHGIQHAGVGANIGAAMRPLWLEKNGLKIAVLSLTTTYPAEAWAGDRNPGVASPRVDLLRRVIQSIRNEADFIVVSFHWGQELSPALRPHQQEHAKTVLAAGADIVVGHHAHVAQVVDVEPSDGIIVYGLGNFIFTSLSRDAKFGLGSHFEFCRNENAPANVGTHSFRMVLTPLLTLNRTTGYRTRMMNLHEFLPFAREYVKKGYFSPELEFFVPGQNQVKTLRDWLQPRQQASKEGSSNR